MFLIQKSVFVDFSFLAIPIELWESTAAIFRQSSGYVFILHFVDAFITVVIFRLDSNMSIFKYFLFLYVLVVFLVEPLI